MGRDTFKTLQMPSLVQRFIEQTGRKDAVSDEHEDWEVSPRAQPRAGDYGFDLDRTLSSVVGLSARVASDAYTAETLGVERGGNGVVIREDGVVLTIGYLVTEAEEVLLETHRGRVIPAHVLGLRSGVRFRPGPGSGTPRSTGLDVR